MRHVGIPTLLIAGIIANGALHAREARRASRRSSILTTRLSLTDEQKSAIAPLVEVRRAKLAARLVTDDGRIRRRHEARAIVADGDRKINAVLSPEQQLQYVQLERQTLEQTCQQ